MFKKSYEKFNEDLRKVLMDALGVFQVSDIIKDKAKGGVVGKIKKHTYKKDFEEIVSKICDEFNKNLFDLQDTPEGIDITGLQEWIVAEHNIKSIFSLFENEDNKNKLIEEAYSVGRATNEKQKKYVLDFFNSIYTSMKKYLWDEMSSEEKKIILIMIDHINSHINTASALIIDSLREDIYYRGSIAEYIDGLKLDYQNDTNARAFDYRSGYFKFHGREKEMRHLKEFCEENKEKFSWMQVIGSGGSGKSRLVHEFVMKNKYEKDWKFIFLNSTNSDELLDKLTGLANYNYHQHLVFVFDYAKKFTKKLKRIFSSIISKKLTNFIKVILIEREVYENNVNIPNNDMFTDSGKFGTDYGDKLDGFLKNQYKKPLEINNLEESEFIHVANDFYEKEGKVITEIEIKKILKQLEKIDSKNRILYFLMMLDAKISGDDVNIWDKNELAKYIIDKEIGNIKKTLEKVVRKPEDAGDALGYYLKILAYVTATEQIDFNDMNNMNNIPDFVNLLLKEYQSYFSPDKKGTVLFEDEEYILSPYTPDIIGEYLSLHILKEYYKPEEVEIFINSCWQFNSYSFLLFIKRLDNDKMYEEENFTKFFSMDKPLGILQEPEKINEDFLWAFSIADFPNMRNLSIGKKIDKLQSYYEESEKNIEIAIAYAKGLVNLTAEQGEKERIKTINELQSYYEKSKKNVEIAVIYAAGLVNLSFEQEKKEERIKTINQLKSIYEETEKNVEIAVIYAAGLFNFSSTPKLKEKEKTIKKIQSLYNEFGYKNETISYIYKGILQKFIKDLNKTEYDDNIERLRREFPEIEI